VELEAAGYTTLSQALDFRPGQDFVHKIQRAPEGAARTIAVLSPEYVESRFGEAEWRAAFVIDPSGERGLLVPVRVSRCEPSGLLGSRIYIDLLGVDEPTARQRLRDGVGPPRARPTSAAWPGRISNDLHPDTASIEAKAAPRSLPGDDPKVTNLPGRHRAIIGRDALLGDLATALCSGRAVVVATGIGGVGKSSLAREYAHRHRDLFDVVWWVPAENATLSQVTRGSARRPSRMHATPAMNRHGFDAASFLEEDVDHVQALPARAARSSCEDGARPSRRVPVGLRGLPGDRPEGGRGC
jgi:hypothetical protein